jgi:UDP-glucose 4-epimerase
MTRAVVFGGSGFLGSHVADALSDAGHEVTIFDVRPSVYIRSDQEMIIGDILDTDSVRKAVEGSDYIFNFAGLADLDDAMTRPIDTVRLNIEGNINILEAAKIYQPKRTVYASTIYVYSNKGGFYRCSKQAAELYIEEFHKRYGINFTILRYGTLYGPRSDNRNSIYRYLKQALTEKKITGYGSGEEIREYIHVRDAALLSVRILSEEFQNQHVILSGQHPMKFKDLLYMIKEMLNNSVEIQLINTPNLDHYDITPYSYIPKIGSKFTLNCYTDLGQGLLEYLHMIDNGTNELQPGQRS